MNKRILAILAILAAFSCQKTPPDEPVVPQDFTVTVALPGEGKATWKSGDQIKGYSLEGGKIASSFNLSAQGEGASATFKASGSVKPGSEYRFLYPAAAAGRAMATGGFLTIPSAQTAVAGAVDDDAFMGFAQVSDVKGSVRISPVAGRLSFTLSGTEAASVQSVTLESAGGEPLAGTVRITPEAGMTVAYEENGSSTITLSGTFETGKEYSFSVVPGSVSGYTLTFRDGEARISKETLGQTQVTAGGKASLGSFTPSFEGSHDWVVYQRATKEGIHPLVLVFMGEGFTEARREEYMDACRAAADLIFTVQPFKHYRDYFSVYIGWMAADQQGPGSPWNVPVHTDANNNRSFNSMGQSGRDKVYDWVAKRCPEILSGTTALNDLGIFMLVDTKDEDIGAVCDWDISNAKMGRFVALVSYAPGKSYGDLPAGKVPQTYGANYYGYYEPGEGTEATKMSMAELEELGYKTVYGGTRAYLSDYRGTFLHEGMGHGFTHLMDEYWIYYNPSYTFPDGSWYKDLTTRYHTLSFPAGLNLSPNRADNPWKNLNAMRSELAAKDKRYERMGAFQGGLVQYMFGIWRPERVSVMMDCRPYFSTWQRALAWQRIMRSSGEYPACDVQNNVEDLRKYMEIDVAIEGIRDPARDN